MLFFYGHNNLIDLFEKHLRNNLISNQNIDKVDIYDMYGKLVSTEKIGAKSYNIDIKDFKNNIYQLACLINNKWYYSKVIIIN